MKYLVGRRGMELRVAEKEVPKPGCGEVLVQVHACGVCGSDIHLLSHCEDWTPLGHEISGEVVEAGPGTHVKPGQRVIVEDLTGCGRCRNCKNGLYHYCTDMISLNGQSGMGEYLCVNEKLLNPYEGLPHDIAALTEPLAVCLNTWLTAQVPPEGNLIIMGLGPLSIMTAALARHYGAGQVILTGSRRGTARNRKREALARSFGADEVFYSAEAGWKDALKQSRRGPVSAIIVTSPPRTLEDAMELADYGTRIVPIGLDMGENSRASIDVDRMVMNKNTIQPFIAEPAKGFPLSLELLKKNVIDGPSVVTHRIPLTDTEGFRNLFLQDSEVVKAVLTVK